MTPGEKGGGFISWFVGTSLTGEARLASCPVRPVPSAPFIPRVEGTDSFFNSVWFGQSLVL